MKKSRSQIACPDSGSGFILGESDKSSIFLKTGFRFLRAGPLGTFQKLRFEDLGVFVRIVIFLFLLTIVFLLSFSRPPRGYVQKKLLHTFNPKPILPLAPGVGFSSQLQSQCVSGRALGTLFLGHVVEMQIG